MMPRAKAVGNASLISLKIGWFSPS